MCVCFCSPFSQTAILVRNKTKKSKEEAAKAFVALKRKHKEGEGGMENTMRLVRI